MLIQTPTVKILMGDHETKCQVTVRSHIVKYEFNKYKSVIPNKKLAELFELYETKIKYNILKRKWRENVVR